MVHAWSRIIHARPPVIHVRSGLLHDHDRGYGQVIHRTDVPTSGLLSAWLGGDRLRGSAIRPQAGPGSDRVQESAQELLGAGILGLLDDLLG
ncbi:MAG: hypothetical protein OEX05_02800, partial [Chloroflexota bacterium]|nr:hypothetical protein [Chloroflexota bacterium]